MQQGRDYRSPEAALYRRWYKTARWQRIRSAQLTAEPLCRNCRRLGRITPATVCDHVDPHRGDEAKFWSGPFQSLCKDCHDSPKQKQEATGIIAGVSSDGRPIDPSHPWNRTPS